MDEIYDLFGGRVDAFLFAIVAIAAVSLFRYLNRRATQATRKQSAPWHDPAGQQPTADPPDPASPRPNIAGQIRAALERATAVPPPISAGQYAAPTTQPVPSIPPPAAPGWTVPPAQSVPPPPPPHVALGLRQHRPPPHPHPTPQTDLDAQVRELMAANNEVAAVRLLCDEAQMGIIEAQQHARSLVTQTPAAEAASPAEPPEPRDLGSAAFATSLFHTDEDEGWASGWIDQPEPEDRSDIEELWHTIHTHHPQP